MHDGPYNTRFSGCGSGEDLVPRRRFCGLVVTRDLDHLLLLERSGGALRVISGPVARGEDHHQALMLWNKVYVPDMRSRWVRFARLLGDDGTDTRCFFAVADIEGVRGSADVLPEGEQLVWRHCSWAESRSADDVLLLYNMVKSSWRSIHDAPEGVGGSVEFRTVSTRRLRPEEAVVGSYEKLKEVEDVQRRG